MNEREKIYDEVCRLNTQYEEIVNRENDDYVTDDMCYLAGEMYELLCDIQNKWETEITAQ